MGTKNRPDMYQAKEIMGTKRNLSLHNKGFND